MRFLAILALSGSAFAATFTSSADGAWSSGLTWGTGATGPVPGVDDQVSITKKVTLDGSRTVGGCRVVGVAAVTIQIGGELIFGTNAALTLQGDLINNAKLTGAPGAQILFDPACTGDTTRQTRAYKLDFGYSGVGTSTFIADANNRGTIKTLRPNGDEAQAYVTASLPGTGGFRTLKYVDFTDMGDSSRTSLAFSAQQGFALDYGYNTFTRCGRVAIGIGSSTLQGSWRIYNNTFTSPPTASTYSLLISNYSTNPGATDVREIKNNSFAGIFGISIANTGWNVHHNVFMGSVATAANATLLAGWHDNLYFYSAGDNNDVTHTLFGVSDFAGNYVANTSTSGHVLYFPTGATAAPLTVNIANNIFEAPNDAAIGTGDITGIGSKPAGYKISVHHNLVLVNPTAHNPQGHLVGNPPTETVIEHNTIGVSLLGQGDPVVSLGEAVTFQRPGNVTAFRSNIFFNQFATANGVKAADFTATATPFQDIILPSGIGFNASWNLATVGSAGSKYPNSGNGYSINLSAPIGNTGLGPQSDLVANPMFKDKDRGLGWYWRTKLGNPASTSATPYLDDSTAAVNYIAQDPETRIDDLMAWVKEGYQIQNPALHNTAHDGGDVGAMPFYAPPPPPPPPSTFVLITDGGSHLYRGTCGGAEHPCRLANSILALVPETGALFKPTDTSAAYQLSATATHPGIHATFATSSFNQWTTYRTAVYLTADSDVPPGRYMITFAMSPIVGGTTTVYSKPFPLIVADPPGPLTRVANPTSNPPPARYYDEMQRVLGTAAKFCHQYSNVNGTTAFNPDYGPYFYDGIKAYYDLYDITGDTQWKDCAVWQAVDFETKSPTDSRNYAFFVEGAYRHWVETGSEAALAVIADRAITSNNSVAFQYIDSAGSPDVERLRPAALELNTLRIAVKAGLGVSNPQYITSRDVLEEVLLTEFDAVVSGNNRNHVKPWMMGVGMQALIAYYEECYQDPRIPLIIKQLADYFWQHNWVDDSDPSLASMGFVNGMPYTIASPIADEYQPVSKAAPALNMLLAPAYSWIYKLTGNTSYRDKYDKMRDGWVPSYDGALGSNAKNFGESFRWDLSALRYLDEALLPTTLAADTTNPTISITGSQTGTVTGTLTITATATDDIGISGVEVWMRPDAAAGVGDYSAANGYGEGWDRNMKYLGLATGTGPYTLTFDINKYTANGTPATIYAVAYDLRRNYTVSNSLTITPSNPIAGDTTPPKITLGLGTFVGVSGGLGDGMFAPIRRLKTDLNQNIGIGDNTSTYFYMEVWVDVADPVRAVKICGDRNTYVNTYSARATYVEPICRIPATTMTLGPHTLTVYAWDEAGNQATFNQMLVIMDTARSIGPWDPDGMPLARPTFDSFNIVHGQILSGTVQLTASATDPNGIYGVQYFVDDIPLGPIVTTTPYTLNWNTSSVPSGQHRISAYASSINYGWATMLVGQALALDKNAYWYAPWPTVPMRYVYVQNTASTAPTIMLRGKMTIGGATKAQR